jgi:hypothetical protein
MQVIYFFLEPPHRRLSFLFFFFSFLTSFFFDLTAAHFNGPANYIFLLPGNVLQKEKESSILSDASAEVYQHAAMTYIHACQ